MENEETLIIRNVNKSYKLDNKETFQALHNISVSFKKGELVSIVGESGSGKSTLMNLIGGLDSDFTGQIIADGMDLGKLSDKELDKYRKDKVGFVFQSFNLISHLSILDNVTLALTLSNVGEKEKIARATKMLQLVGLESQLKKKPTQLSGGQKQRVAIARALINNPDIIIADEPTGALDTTTSMQILKILKEIADSGKLVIMVTHSEKVASISSRVVEISDGRITNDTPNKNYRKGESFNLNVEEEKKEENKKELKQNLSLWSAVRLSFHNMWASKVKNFLMAFGVAIGIGSLIVMLCFSSGIVDFINSTMTSYSDPTIVTLSKSATMEEIASFTEDDISQIVETINNEANLTDYTLSQEDISYGFQVATITPMFSASINYDFDNSGIAEYDENETLSLIYLYTTPPYYSDSTIVEGDLCSSDIPEDADYDAEIMLTPAIYNFFGEENPVGKIVELKITYNGSIISRFAKISGIVDTSVMSGFPVLYINYDAFEEIYNSQTEVASLSPLQPNTLYIQTPSKEIADAINAFVRATDDPIFEGVSGSIEESLANMFTNLTNTIGSALIVISVISLLVSAIMILVVMYMSVTERTKEIGVLKSIGARKKDIKRIFSSESFLVGLLSGICGLVFAGILLVVVYILLTSLVGFAPLSFRWYYPFIALGVSIIISVLSGLYPASKAARLDPVESLRRE